MRPNFLGKTEAAISGRGLQIKPSDRSIRYCFYEILGRALPLVNNPIYIAEEFAMLDNLSKGRIIAGFVRGIGSEYHSSGVNPFFSHERFHEAHDLIIRAWTEPAPWSSCACKKVCVPVRSTSRTGRKSKSRDESNG